MDSATRLRCGRLRVGEQHDLIRGRDGSGQCGILQAGAAIQQDELKKSLSLVITRRYAFSSSAVIRSGSVGAGTTRAHEVVDNYDWSGVRTRPREPKSVFVSTATIGSRRRSENNVPSSAVTVVLPTPPLGDLLASQVESHAATSSSGGS